MSSVFFEASLMTFWSHILVWWTQKRTGTRLTVIGCSLGGVSVVTRSTLLTVLSFCVLPTVLQHTNTSTASSVSMTLCVQDGFNLVFLSPFFRFTLSLQSTSETLHFLSLMERNLKNIQILLLSELSAYFLAVNHVIAVYLFTCSWQNRSHGFSEHIISLSF